MKVQFYFQVGEKTRGLEVIQILNSLNEKIDEILVSGQKHLVIGVAVGDEYGDEDVSVLTKSEYVALHVPVVNKTYEVDEMYSIIGNAIMSALDINFVVGQLTVLGFSVDELKVKLSEVFAKKN